jgi:hypothetical protein
LTKDVIIKKHIALYIILVFSITPCLCFSQANRHVAGTYIGVEGSRASTCVIDILADSNSSIIIKGTMYRSDAFGHTIIDSIYGSCQLDQNAIQAEMTYGPFGKYGLVFQIVNDSLNGTLTNEYHQVVSSIVCTKENNQLKAVEVVSNLRARKDTTPPLGSEPELTVNRALNLPAFLRTDYYNFLNIDLAQV